MEFNQCDIMFLKRLYYAYQIEMMMRKGISLEDFLDTALDMKMCVEKIRGLKKNATPEYLIERLANGHGVDGTESWWISFNDFIRMALDKYAYALIRRMNISREEKANFKVWLDDLREKQNGKIEKNKEDEKESLVSEKEKIKKLYNAYQLDMLTKRQISLKKFLEKALKVKAAKEAKGEKVSVASIMNQLGYGENDFEWWRSLGEYEENIYHDGYINHDIYDLIERLPFDNEQERRDLEKWVTKVREDTTKKDLEIEDRVWSDYEDDGISDDDWLGPHPDTTWEDLYDKD